MIMTEDTSQQRETYMWFRFENDSLYLNAVGRGRPNYIFMQNKPQSPFTYEAKLVPSRVHFHYRSSHTFTLVYCRAAQSGPVKLYLHIILFIIIVYLFRLKMLFEFEGIVKNFGSCLKYNRQMA